VKTTREGGALGPIPVLAAGAPELPLRMVCSPGWEALFKTVREAGTGGRYSFPTLLTALLSRS
jgi:hypothetical protein